MRSPLCLLLALLGVVNLTAQDLNWNTVAYTTGSLNANFGSIGTPAAFVSLAITGNTNRLDAGFPVKYAANPPGAANDCAVNCALRSSITFAALNETVVYTFTFISAVTTLSFTLYDIDGNNTSGDQANVTATGPSGAATITMANVNTPQSTITGSGTTSATVTGTQGNTTDHITNVSVSGSISTLVVTYRLNPANPSAGNRSFSIGNMNWSGVLPVKWISFSGNRNNDISTLTWEVAEEINVDHYNIQRSTDNRNFITIGSVSFNPGGSGTNKYSYTDRFINHSNLFYRIQQLDLDGQSNFSSTLLLRSNGRSTAFIYPNPTRDVIYINSSNVQGLTVNIYNTRGSKILTSSAVNNNINVSALPAGCYMIEIFLQNGERFHSSFIKI